MIKFTISGGKLVLDPSIILFDELQELYKVKDGHKWLQVIYYLHSSDHENPFRDLDPFVLEENVLMVVFKKSTFKALKMTKTLEKQFLAAEKLFLKYTSSPEKRLLKAIDKKMDEISKMLDDNVPVIEESINAHTGETKFNTNLTIMLNAFAKIETIMKSKTILSNAVMKSEGVGRTRGGGTTSFRERGLGGD